jgi:hypothetical protein
MRGDFRGQQPGLGQSGHRLGLGIGHVVKLQCR